MRHRPALLSLIAVICALSCASCGPHMRIQASIKPYEQKMPNAPVGTVPTRGRLQTYTALQSASAANPLTPNPTVLSNGRIYYGYYCVMCHGADGRGNGPVGQSYVPKPTDLTSASVTGMTDGRLYRGMLSGVGHSPVMDQTVLPEHRWPLVLYVRTLSKSPRTPAQTP